MEKLRLAGCIILSEAGVLLLHKTKKDWYEFPGGKIEAEESAESAATRELKEELSCDVEIIKKLGVKDFEDHGRVMEYHWFLAKVKTGTPIIQEPENFSHMKTIPINELKQVKVSPNVQNFIDEFKKGSINLKN